MWLYVVRAAYRGPRRGVRKRKRGEIEKLPSGSLRIKVYAGIAPLSGKRNYLTGTPTRWTDRRHGR